MIETYIKTLEQKADSPKRTIQEARERTGKRVVGWVAPYAPEEIIDAAGCIPVGLWGGEVELKKARTYLPAFACSIMQSIMEYETDGTYDILSAVLIPAPCDTLKCFGQKWKGKCPAIPFVHPQNRRVESSNVFLANEYRMIIRKLEEILNVKITEEALRKSIIFYNKYRDVMRTFTTLCAEHLDIITPVKRHKIIKAGMFMDKWEYIKIVEKIIWELRKLPKSEWSGKRVIVTGITMEPQSLLEIFEQFGIAVVADDLAQESRQFRTKVPYYGDAVDSLAKQWQDHEGCSLAFDPYKSRMRMLVETARAKQADGIIIALMKFCDPEEYDVPIIMEECKKAGIPVLTIEIDQQASSFEQIRTRVQGFAESM